ncbi:hypothetical protein DRW07_11750 [Alteromonas sediminis]|uniref:Uncharacterized protein n=1 Tax=Alteromonas sediminis TaxID=2259342 RepID=A0A3N5Y1A8_9ALTE|nr:hypothetical protein [Alteromonas sediminis]RPJ66743.1 hypothetical protein DRW07_11750 [Alteromonas sediminis]
MVGKLVEMDRSEISLVSGGGAWDDFWHDVGSAIGSLLAESAYSKQSKDMHDLGSAGNLDEFLSNQSDPLL